MAALPEALEKLVTLLSRLPGIGPRTATRLAFHVLSEPGGYAGELAQALGEVTERVGFCSDCHHVAEGDLCGVCRSGGRDRRTICVVEGVAELLAFERTGTFDGLYHVLHGSLAPLKGIGPGELRLDNLRARVERDAVEEIIVATSTGVEGEATALYIARTLAGVDVDVTRIATGVPMGGDLEYVDPNTLGRALSGRVSIR